MKQKSKFRILVGLLAAALFVVGFFFFRAGSSTAASALPPHPLKGLKLLENIELGLPGVHLIDMSPNSPEYHELQKRGECKILTGAKRLETRDLLVNEIGKDLRAGEVPFVSLPREAIDNYVQPEDEKMAGKLFFAAQIQYVRGMYVGRVRAELHQPLYLVAAPSPTVTVTTWAMISPTEFATPSHAELLPKLRHQIRRATDDFIHAYRAANGLPPTPRLEFSEDLKPGKPQGAGERRSGMPGSSGPSIGY